MRPKFSEVAVVYRKSLDALWGLLGTIERIIEQANS